MTLFVCFNGESDTRIYSSKISAASLVEDLKDSRSKYFEICCRSKALAMRLYKDLTLVIANEKKIFNVYLSTNNVDKTHTIAVLEDKGDKDV